MQTLKYDYSPLILRQQEHIMCLCLECCEFRMNDRAIVYEGLADPDYYHRLSPGEIIFTVTVDMDTNDIIEIEYETHFHTPLHELGAVK